jgi:hypothetical protein
MELQTESGGGVPISGVPLQEARNSKIVPVTNKYTMDFLEVFIIATRFSQIDYGNRFEQISSFYHILLIYCYLCNILFGEDSKKRRNQSTKVFIQYGTPGNIHRCSDLTRQG